MPARIAGRIRHPGRFVMLLPRELDMVEAGRAMPLPLAKPANIVEEAKKEAAAEAKKNGRPPIVRTSRHRRQETGPPGPRPG